MFQVTERVTGGILWANLALLFFLSLFPFTTEWVDTTSYARTPVIVYGADLFAAGVVYWILQSVIIRSQGPDSALRRAVGRDLKGKISPPAYIAGCVAAALGGAGAGPGRPGIWVAVGCYVAVAALWIIPDRRIESRITADRSVPGPLPGPGAAARPGAGAAGPVDGAEGKPGVTWPGGDEYP